MKLLDRIADNWCALPTLIGEFRMYDTGDEGVRVICMGDLHHQGDEPLLRIHSSCLASEVFGAVDCDCADQLSEAMKLIALEGCGLIVHLHQEGRGQGLSQKIRAVRKMQEDGLDTVEAFQALGLEQDVRRYDEVLQLLENLGLSSVRLISNNPRKARFLEQRGVRVKIINTHPRMRRENASYLKTKKSKLGHLFELGSADKLPENIFFYHSDQPWGEFSNFSRHAVFIDDRVWATVEHFYQAQKFRQTQHQEMIRRCPTPIMAKTRSRELSILHERSDWQESRESAMLRGLRAKFNQHPELTELLLQSGDAILVEHTADDAYWGDGGDGSGQNRLGHLLMQVRTELLDEKVIGVTLPTLEV